MSLLKAHNCLAIEQKKKASLLHKGANLVQRVFLTGTIFMAATVPTYATGGLNNVSSTDIMSQIIKVLLTIFQFVGLFSLVQGIALAILGQRTDDPERRSKGVVEAIIGGILIGLGFLLQPIFNLVGITVS